MGKWEEPQAFFNSSADTSGQLQTPAALLNREELPVHNEYDTRWVPKTVQTFLRMKILNPHSESIPNSSFI
jgi:hypothetical protein